MSRSGRRQTPLGAPVAFRPPQPGPVVAPAAGTMAAEPYEQELQLEKIFHSLSTGFQKLDKLPEGKQQAALKELTAEMQEAKT